MITPVPGPLTGGEIAASAITTAKINTAAVTTSKIAESAVTSSKIKALAVGASELAASAVTTTKINANAVTSTKIAAANVVATSIGTSAVISAKIAASAVTAIKLRASSLDYIVYKGVVSDAGLSNTGLCSIATAGFIPQGVIAVPLAHTSIIFAGVRTIPATSKPTLLFKTLTATGVLRSTSNTITFYYEYMRP